MHDATNYRPIAVVSVVVDIISNSIDSGNAVCVAFLDLKKHLIHWTIVFYFKGLSELGVSTAALGWFKNYLTNRFHWV